LLPDEILSSHFINANGTKLFFDALNRNCGYVPNESLDIIIASGQNMLVDQDYTCKNLQFELGSSFNCTGGSVLTITEGVLDANGKIAIDVTSSLEVRSSIEIAQP
jgi:hypothetical protein